MSAPFTKADDQGTIVWTDGKKFGISTVPVPEVKTPLQREIERALLSLY